MTDDDNTFVRPAPGDWGIPLSSLTYEIATMRDQFAMAALTGLLANPKLAPTVLQKGASWFDKNAYEYADAMMEARKNG
jgi:hypothetical protein